MIASSNVIKEKEKIKPVFYTCMIYAISSIFCDGSLDDLNFNFFKF